MKTIVNLTTGEIVTRDLTAEEIAALPAPQPDPIPQSVTRFQALAALAQAGLFITVDNMMMQFPVDDLRRLAWLDAQTFERNSPTMLEMAAALNLSDPQLDALFTAAADIVA